ncbi:type III secretion system effector E3 ubiquitin transferase SspH2 [Salmonella enterica subsp. enterica serovar Carno]|uniref:type III secretion system effector E3 ubiquitin transferase SspH2 n=1 Tax=Salmonella enterica TaxID=28901 RepID=UPI00126AA8E2|nr:type III secretion system effector E3 ubiquitin transferase SspH2 [Salmonella enterica]EBW2075465.1 type III secretion system effector E3 ubiquitin transferase SspH2 [Salmonella enterica subsp. enterica serovar Krefeld]ECF6646358.1 type III secretion system effector E3 ubiquitin transferase SspH2 [Salmonella enterica subsp. enterica]EBS0850180.1 type III secretion system effector E3 ubiquitin transferase SspH2 [Salmonella enterica subsp. enterica serovar Carno]EBS4551224.1 type III secretion
MPLHVGSGCLPATITNLRINCIAQSATPPEMSLWEKIKEFFCSTHQTEALECIWTICHPSVGTTREDVVSRFEQLRMLAYAGYEESIHSGRHGESHFCILDADNQEILSVTLDDAGNYTVNCQGHNETYRFTMDIEQGEECTEHAEGASGTLQVSPLPAPAAPQTPAEYDAVWSEWTRVAPAEELRGRAATVQRICTCLNNGSRELNVGESGLTALPDCLPAHITTLVIPHNNYLTSLPTLPSGLEVLTVEDNQLTSLPPLPAGLELLTVSGNQLTSLPPLPAGLQVLLVAGNQLTSLPPLPAGLQMLLVAGNQLTSLPPLPAGLQMLSVAGNQLTSLPPLPAGLQMLSVAGNQLTSLPPLPAGLQVLLVARNQLTSLPLLPAGLELLTLDRNPQLVRLPPLPEGLQTLSVDANPQLTRLPALPSGLQRLYARNNQLTRLPESITGLSSEATVNLEGNPLSERTLQALRDITSAPGYSGPRILFDMAGASAPREARALHLAAADWLVPAREGEPAPADRWHMFGQEDNAAAFSLFLDRLSETENFIKDAGFKAQITSWLAQLAEDEALRAKTFAMATEATASCQDRVTLALHQMKNVQLVHDAEKGQYDNNLVVLVATGREMFRLEKLEQIAREKAGTLALADDVEVYLAYQNKLKKALGLTSVTAEMRFFGVSGVTVSDLQAAELQVKAAEKSEFREWILQWGPLHGVLERKAPERVNALREKQISDYEETYRMLSDTELRPFGLVGNTDAERSIGARAMESAKKTFLDGLRPLVEEMLGSYLAS